MNERFIRKGVVNILEGVLGPAWKADHNYEDTPRRVAAFYKEMFSRREFVPTVFTEKHDQMIVLAHHKDVTLCPHHLLPVFLDISLAYVPDKDVLGLSKLIRLVQCHFTEPLLQETLTDSVADELVRLVKPLGAACLIEGAHTCMQIRGPKSTGRTVTSAMRGVFLENIDTRNEFLDLILRR